MTGRKNHNLTNPSQLPQKLPSIRPNINPSINPLPSREPYIQLNIMRDSQILITMNQSLIQIQNYRMTDYDIINWYILYVVGGSVYVIGLSGKVFLCFGGIGGFGGIGAGVSGLGRGLVFRGILWLFRCSMAKPRLIAIPTHSNSKVSYCNNYSPETSQHFPSNYADESSEPA